MRNIMPVRACALCLLASYMPNSHAAWQMVVLPDTQNYFVNLPHKLPGLQAQIDWINQIQPALAVGTGDITVKNAVAEWEAAYGIFSNLTVPYILPTGNHDYTPVGSYPRDEWKPSSLFNQYFGFATAPGMVPFEGDWTNSATPFTAPDGRQITVVSMEQNVRPEVVQWARQFNTGTMILATHANLEEGDADETGEPTTQRDVQGDWLWERFADDQPNLELIVNGHDYDGSDTDPYGTIMTARQTTIAAGGNVVTEIGFNTQFLSDGGGGWLRVYTFLDDRTTVQVETYSPVLDLWARDSRNEFTFQLTPVGFLTGWQAGSGDFDGDGDTDGRDFLEWQRSQSAVVAVPEPCGLVLLLFLFFHRMERS